MEKRFISPTFISIILVGIALILSFLPFMLGNPPPDIIPIFPGGTLSDILLTIIIPYLTLLIILIIGPMIAIVLVKLHKLMKLHKYNYFIFISDKKLSGSRILLRSVFGGLLAVNIAIYISYTDLAPQIYYLANDPAQLFAVIEYAAVIIGLPIACILILPVWMIKSSGLMCSRNLALYSNPAQPDIEGVGEFYIRFLKGYVGISTVLSYSLILIDTFNNPPGEMTWMFVFVDPIVIIMLFLPMSLIAELVANKTNVRLNSRYEKLGIDSTPKTINVQ